MTSRSNQTVGRQEAPSPKWAQAILSLVATFPTGPSPSIPTRSHRPSFRDAAGLQVRHEGLSQHARIPRAHGGVISSAPKAEGCLGAASGLFVLITTARVNSGGTGTPQPFSAFRASSSRSKASGRIYVVQLSQSRPCTRSHGILLAWLAREQTAQESAPESRS